jgi:hypothetical protein
MRKPSEPRMLAREVAELPARDWMPLNHAFAVARKALGYDAPTARDLTARARAGLIGVALRELRPDREVLMILAREFWSVSEITPQWRVRSQWRLGSSYFYVRRIDVERNYGDGPDSVILSVAAKLWPDGCEKIGTGIITKKVGDEMRRLGFAEDEIPDRHKISRALVRRKD